MISTGTISLQLLTPMQVRLDIVQSHTLGGANHLTRPLRTRPHGHFRAPTNLHDRLLPTIRRIRHRRNDRTPLFIRRHAPTCWTKDVRVPRPRVGKQHARFSGSSFHPCTSIAVQVWQDCAREVAYQGVEAVLRRGIRWSAFSSYPFEASGDLRWFALVCMHTYIHFSNLVQ
jgi:hypothetical protein